MDDPLSWAAAGAAAWNPAFDVTPAELVDVIVTERGIAINPLRRDLIETLPAKVERHLGTKMDGLSGERGHN